MNIYVMKAYKYDGKIHYEQPLILTEVKKNHIVLTGKKGRELLHHTRNTTITFMQETREYFFTDRWYTASFVCNEEGIYDYIYCNICMPAEITDNEVRFLDLEVDIIYEKEEIRVVDTEEFEVNRIKYGYPPEVVTKVKETIVQLINDMKTNVFPFSSIDNIKSIKIK